jgi:hypothetical protein
MHYLRHASSHDRLDNPRTHTFDEIAEAIKRGIKTVKVGSGKTVPLSRSALVSMVSRVLSAAPESPLPYARNMGRNYAIDHLRHEEIAVRQEEILHERITFVQDHKQYVEEAKRELARLIEETDTSGRYDRVPHLMALRLAYIDEIPMTEWTRHIPGTTYSPNDPDAARRMRDLFYQWKLRGKKLIWDRASPNLRRYLGEVGKNKTYVSERMDEGKVLGRIARKGVAIVPPRLQRWRGEQ